MDIKSLCIAATAIVVLSASASSAVAQEITYTWTCQDVGHSTPEALGDRVDLD